MSPTAVAERPTRAAAGRSPSPVTQRASAFVAERLPAARALGRRLSDDLGDPAAFVAALTAGFERLADPEYRAAQAWLAPGAADVIGVRWPLVQAVQRALRRPLAETSPALALDLAQALSAARPFEVRLFAHMPLRRSLPADPERSWQLIRRLARAAGDWVSVDSLAGVVAAGVLLEPFRWAELELLVYSPHHWERRLVGSTLAGLPFRLPPAERPDLAPRPGLTIIEAMIGDDEPDVQKALSWALRSWREVDPAGVTALLRREAARARDIDDGARAWVVRDALTGARADPALAAELRPLLAGLRRRAGAPNTSRAQAAALTFIAGGLPDVRDLPVDPSR
jgi:3-methyladenine DNA glycosylase AlkD